MEFWLSKEGRGGVREDRIEGRVGTVGGGEERGRLGGGGVCTGRGRGGRGEGGG